MLSLTLVGTSQLTATYWKGNMHSSAGSSMTVVPTCRHREQAPFVHNMENRAAQLCVLMVRQGEQQRQSRFQTREADLSLHLVMEESVSRRGRNADSPRPWGNQQALFTSLILSARLLSGRQFVRVRYPPPDEGPKRPPMLQQIVLHPCT